MKTCKSVWESKSTDRKSVKNESGCKLANLKNSGQMFSDVLKDFIFLNFVKVIKIQSG